MMKISDLMDEKVKNKFNVTQYDIQSGYPFSELIVTTYKKEAQEDFALWFGDWYELMDFLDTE